MIVTAHQPNLLPGESVVQKLEASDACIWLDEVQHTKGGFVNRNRLRDGTWLTVPVERVTDGLPINRVKISEHGRWRTRAVRHLQQLYGSSLDDVCAEILRPYRLLVGLNLALLRLALADVHAAWHFQSHLDGGRAVVAVSDERKELLPISDRLAMMVAEVGGDVYLSGPSGFRYLSEAPFASLGVEVRYFDWHEARNPSVLERLAAVRN